MAINFKRFFILGCLLLSGCTIAPQREGFQPFSQFLQVRVNIVPSPRLLPKECHALAHNLQGCAYHKGEIWIIGTATPGGIDLEEWVVGHEIQHLLHWRTGGRVVDPDAQ